MSGLKHGEGEKQQFLESQKDTIEYAPTMGNIGELRDLVRYTTTRGDSYQSTKFTTAPHHWKES